MPLPNKESKEITPLGLANFRNKKVKFGIKLDDRRRHVYVIGKTGVGKSTLLENMIIADMRAGRGVGVIDPHGELADRIVEFVPEDRLDDVVYFNPADMEYPIAFNPMEQVGTEFRHLVASGLMGVFKKIFIDVWSARMAYILNNTLLALLEFPGSTILGVMRMYSDPAYRKKIVDNLKDPVVKGFWTGEYAKYTQRLESEAVSAIQNKIGQFVSNPLIRNILGQSHSTLNMRDIMDSGKIFIVNLAKGRIGEDNSALLGAMIITRLQLAAMARVDMEEAKRKDFFLYVDEFQNFATDSFASILSEARKYRLSLALAHQYIGQLVTSDNNTKVRDAVFGNVGTIVNFRVGAADAEFLEKEFMPEFLQNDLVNLSKANVYMKLMIDGLASRPFSAETLPPQKAPLVSYRDVIIQNSREHYATPRKVVDERISTEMNTGSEAVIQDKLVRQGERSPRDVLRSAPPERRAMGPRPREGSYSDNGPRQEYQQRAPHFNERPTYNSAPQRQMSDHDDSSGWRPLERRQGGERRQHDEHPPQRAETPRREERPMHEERPSEKTSAAYNPPRPPEIRRPQEAPMQKPNHKTPPPAKSMDERLRERPPMPQAHKKPDIDIDALRNAISKSLGKKEEPEDGN
ncbi:MAG: type IV secretion system DNA-binding domain-containing protein [Candidatus Liptonbacteria bacterium]|nr:type IV secretion system DNA-binding domain-containing protein [Candidatus Liptonbacteria bacterium]